MLVSGPVATRCSPSTSAAIRWMNSTAGSPTGLREGGGRSGPSIPVTPCIPGAWEISRIPRLWRSDRDGNVGEPRELEDLAGVGGGELHRRSCREPSSPRAGRGCRPRAGSPSRRRGRCHSPGSRATPCCGPIRPLCSCRLAPRSLHSVPGFAVCIEGWEGSRGSVHQAGMGEGGIPAEPERPLRRYAVECAAVLGAQGVLAQSPRPAFAVAHASNRRRKR